jgi:hypothetical protein
MNGFKESILEKTAFLPWIEDCHYSIAGLYISIEFVERSMI